MAEQPSPILDPVHTLWMRRALQLAEAAFDSAEVPVGAVIVRDGEALSEAHNRTVGDATRARTPKCWRFARLR